MLDTLFPTQVSNDYEGSPIARWVFAVITSVTIGRSLVHVTAPDGGAQSIVTIPLDTFTPGGAAAVVLLFSLWGLSQLLIGIICVVVIWRYRTLIPFMYLLVTLEYGMRIVLGIFKPIQTTGTAPGGVGNYIVFPLAMGMLILSLGNKANMEK
ncbi:MAG: hypothetical protein PVG71_00720 [Anaerolineae bacterium]|jgi:hypothetical protein